MLAVKCLYWEEREVRVNKSWALDRHLESQFEYEYAPLLVPLVLIVAYYNWLSSFQWLSDSKPIVPRCTAPHFIWQILLFAAGKIQLTSPPEDTV